MKHIKHGLFIFSTFIFLIFSGCKAEVNPKSGDETTLTITVNGLANRTVFPDVQVANLTNINLTYSKVGSEDEITKTWATMSDVIPIAIDVGSYDFNLSADYCGFTYSGSKDGVIIVSGDNTVDFDLKLSEVKEEDMTGNGTIEHSLTYPKTDDIDHVTVALYKYDDDDNLVIAVEEETVTVTDNEDGTVKASYTKEVDAGEYVMKYFFYADEEETLCMDEYSVVVYVLKDVKSKADEETERICSVYSVVYDLNGGAWAEGYTAPVQFTYLDGVTFPAAENVARAGYDFVKWSTTNSSSGTAVTAYNEQKDIKVYAIWKARTDTVYTVKYWKQNIADDEYTEDEALVETKTGTTDTNTSVTAPEITGFTVKTFDQVNIDGDGSAVVNLYYDRNIYYITFVLGSATTETELDENGRISGRYGAAVQMKVPTMSGYIFKSWLNEVNEEESLPTTFAADRTFIANFESLGSGGGTSLNMTIINEDVKIVETTATTSAITVKAEEGYASYSWTVNGAKQSSTTNTLTFSAGSSYDYRISVTAKKNGIRYSTNAIVETSYAAKFRDLLTMIPVIAENTTITGNKSSGVFLSGRTVTLSPYSIGKYQVTQKVYEEIMGTNPSYFSSSPASGETQEFRPVENINWYSAIAFCNKLSLKAGYDLCYSVKDSDGNEIDWANLSHSSIPTSNNSYWNAAVCDMTKNGYRLPTEAEWEFAARGGDQSADDWSYTYSGSNTIGDVAWYSSNSDSKTHEVGLKDANRLGIYDMSGNVWEWCQDWYDGVSSSETVTDPTGGASGSDRVRCGGSYYCSYCAVSNWTDSNPYSYLIDCGFRLARSADNWEEEHDKAVAKNSVQLPDMVSVTTASTTIIGDQSSGVFLSGRTVTLSPYSIGKYQVTQKLYKLVMGANPSNFSSSPADGETQELRPVDNINWYRAIAFCNKLSLKAGYDLCYSVKDSSGNEIDWANLSHSSIPTSSNSYWNAAVCDMTKNGYRLPTEAEWEFAARGGDQSADDWSYTYSGSNTIGDVAWYSSNSSSKTHEVGLKDANRLGIYDMSGNVWEWCQDWYGSISSSETVTDPTGGASGSSRVQRGGSYYDDSYCAVSYRYNFIPYYCYDFYDFGFRLARSSSN